MWARNPTGICQVFCWGKDVTKRWEAFLLIAENLDHTAYALPSRINEDRPISRAKDIALAVARASTISDEKGRWICSDNETRTWPWPFLITTPKPAFPMSLNVAPLKFTFRELNRGGDHRECDGNLVTEGAWAVLFALEKSWRAWTANGTTCEIGKSSFFTRIWFRRYQSIHITIASFPMSLSSF